MRHHNSNRKFGRVSNKRVALIRSLAISVIEKGKITTTEAKAKELRPILEKMVTKARIKTLSHRRLLVARLGGHERATRKLIEEVGPKYEKRPGGYIRITKLAQRGSRKMAVLEFV